MKKIETCIVIANGTKARLYFNDGPGHGLKARPDLDMARKEQHARDIQSDKPGRSFESQGGARHAIEYASDPQRVAERRFLGDIIARLRELEHDSAFDRLVLVASPKVLGDMRRLLPRSLGAKIYVDVNKDLTHLSDHDLVQHLKDVIVL